MLQLLKDYEKLYRSRRLDCITYIYMCITESACACARVCAYTFLLNSFVYFYFLFIRLFFMSV